MHHDRRQNVVEIMRYTPGQLANRFELLRLAQLFLQSFPICHISVHSPIASELAGRVEYRHAAGFQDHQTAIPMPVGVLKCRGRLSLRKDFLEDHTDSLRLRFRHEIERCPS
ncbi:hypothetical protein SDC9_165537 [bioreactor metagenome]|uniref:Uncharacterized protein n=1 Tax=bioreactor metagenome TaxID=1076179 RepID=A0A645FX41_9ZZZZ